MVAYVVKDVLLWPIPPHICLLKAPVWLTLSASPKMVTIFLGPYFVHLATTALGSVTVLLSTGYIFVTTNANEPMARNQLAQKQRLGFLT